MSIMDPVDEVLAGVELADISDVLFDFSAPDAGRTRRIISGKQSDFTETLNIGDGAIQVNSSVVYDEISMTSMSLRAMKVNREAGVDVRCDFTAALTAKQTLTIDGVSAFDWLYERVGGKMGLQKFSREEVLVQLRNLGIELGGEAVPMYLQHLAAKIGNLHPDGHYVDGFGQAAEAFLGLRASENTEWAARRSGNATRIMKSFQHPANGARVHWLEIALADRNRTPNRGYTGPAEALWSSFEAATLLLTDYAVAKKLAAEAVDPSEKQLYAEDMAKVTAILSQPARRRVIRNLGGTYVQANGDGTRNYFSQQVSCGRWGFVEGLNDCSVWGNRDELADQQNRVLAVWGDDLSVGQAAEVAADKVPENTEEPF